jgi:hypothetical protein
MPRQTLSHRHSISRSQRYFHHGGDSDGVSRLFSELSRTRPILQALIPDHNLDFHHVTKYLILMLLDFMLLLFHIFLFYFQVFIIVPPHKPEICAVLSFMPLPPSRFPSHLPLLPWIMSRKEFFLLCHPICFTSRNLLEGKQDLLQLIWKMVNYSKGSDIDAFGTSSTFVVFFRFTPSNRCYFSVAIDELLPHSHGRLLLNRRSWKCESHYQKVKTWDSIWWTALIEASTLLKNVARGNW